MYQRREVYISETPACWPLTVNIMEENSIDDHSCRLISYTHSTDFYKPRTSVGPITRTMKTYEVEMITDLNEEVSVCIEAPSADKAGKGATGMLEDGELDCQSQVCMEYSVTET